jgi:putative N6-adenine-specific DNA methylase
MTDLPVSRAGGKLEAAIERFQLEPRIRSARAVDVGASTGGFTEALLRHGATHVTAVDVGRGQLHPSLRDDARVTNLEGVHWKTLPLSEAPGPFDFFTVDVSFVAARTMLRGLAFRLREGAEGVVLVKPQFELPDSLVKGGNVTDPQLRQAALDKVREKAEQLGFQLMAHADSPVAGREGTVEILAHLRFLGRSEKLPKPGEKRAGARPGRAAAAPGVEPRHYFAVAAPGLEPVVEREVRALPGVEEVRAVVGGIEFAGSREVLYRANLWLRCATRVLVRLGEVEAREFARLRRRSSGLPWDRFVPPDAPLDLHVSQKKSRLYHTGAVAETLALAVADAVRGHAPDEARPKMGVFARGQADQWTLSVDSSGELLHKRGFREEGAQAPMRETLAAALLQLCEWDPSTPLVDPMCGAGTIVMEACLAAMRVAPGLERSFAFFRWPSFDAALWQRLVDEARAVRLNRPPAAIAGSDHAPAAVAAARHNLERAGLAAQVQVETRALRELHPPTGTGLVLANPPYGKRVGEARTLVTLYAELGRVLKSRFAGWRAGVLVPQGHPATARRLESALGGRLLRSTALWNGGLRVKLVELRY